MHPSFKEGFEKNAFMGKLIAGAGKKLYAGAKALGKKLTGNTVSVGKKGQKLKKPKWEFSAGKTLMTGGIGALGAMEVSDVASRTGNTSKSMSSTAHRGMTGSAINNLPRRTNINSGLGQARHR